jgi:hypothetical protein
MRYLNEIGTAKAEAQEEVNQHARVAIQKLIDAMGCKWSVSDVSLSRHGACIQAVNPAGVGLSVVQQDS